MKIGIEGQRLFRKKKHGMDMVALELIKNLQLIDKENEYVVFVKPDEDNEALQPTGNFKIVELEGGSYPFWEQKALPKAAEEEGCDLLHCTSNTAPVKSKVPVMITLHDIIYMESISIFKKSGTWYQKFGNLYRRIVVPKVVKKSKKIITVSQFERERIRKFFNFNEDDKRLVAVYNGVSRHFNPVTDESIREEVRTKYDLPEKYLFFLGNTDPKKNTEGVLKAYANYVEQSDDPAMLVMLDYEEWALNKVLADIGKKHIRKHIFLPGYIVNTDLPAIYSMATIFLYPSLRESFGIPMLEAMGCGTPVITSNTSSMPEVSGGKAKIVDPYQPQQITEAIFELMNDPSLRQKLVEEGLQQAAKFTWKNMAKDVKAIYEEITSKQK
ncbi:MAG TPA: glycosyltransferase family 1 protein [Bacteroidales bacterium]|nr:glycosyltransferase family 1 protein [Bacteroidales bacterium]